MNKQNIFYLQYRFNTFIILGLMIVHISIFLITNLVNKATSILENNIFVGIYLLVLFFALGFLIYAFLYFQKILHYNIIKATLCGILMGIIIFPILLPLYVNIPLTLIILFGLVIFLFILYKSSIEHKYQQFIQFRLKVDRDKILSIIKDFSNRTGLNLQIINDGTHSIDLILRKKNFELITIELTPLFPRAIILSLKDSQYCTTLDDLISELEKIQELNIPNEYEILE